MSVGFLLFAAWFFNLEFLTKVPVDLTPTNPTTAIGLILLGVSLWWLRDPSASRLRRRLAQVSAGIVGVLGAAALVDFALGWSLRIDQLTEREGSVEASASVPYLTAPATALSYVLLGGALLFLDFRTRQGAWPAQLLVLTTAAVSLLAAAGYYYGAENLYQVTAFTTQTLPSLIILSMLCLGILCARPERGLAAAFVSDQTGGMLMRRFLPAAVLLPLLVSGIHLFGEGLGLFHFEFGQALLTTVLIVAFVGLVWWTSVGFNRLDVEVKQTAESLRQSNTQLRRDMMFFRGIAETVPGYLFTWRPDGSNTFACPNFYKLTGLPPDSAKGDGWTRAIHPDDRGKTMALWGEALKSGRSLDVKHRLLMAGCGYHWAITRACAVRNEQAEIRAWFGFSTDIDEQKQNEEKLESAVAERTVELQERAAQLSRMASDLTLTEQRERRRLAEIVQENLQQLLVGAKFHLNVVSNRLEKAEKPAALEVDKLLDESLAVSKSLTSELSPPILHDGGLVAGLEWLARRFKEKHGLIVALEADPTVVVEREDLRIMLFEAIRELLVNVVKHAKVNRAKVAVSRKGDDEFKAVVEDDGVGFESATIFYSSNQLNDRFGLFNLRERLSFLGGGVEIESSPGNGTRTTIAVPCHNTPDGSGERGSKVKPTEDGPQSQKGKAPFEDTIIRVLLVDDHAMVRQGIASLLVDEGDLVVVGEAGNGAEAIEQARTLKPDVVLMDYSMPRMDGIEATRAIHEELPQIRVIGLSMYEEEDRAKAMIDAGANAFLSKGGTSEALVAAIRNHAPNYGETSSTSLESADVEEPESTTRNR